MGLLDLIFPRNCLGCGRAGAYICNDCLGKVPKARNHCILCFKSSVDGSTHFRCQRRFLIDGAYSCWKYTGVVRKAIVSLKYKFASDIASELAYKFVEEIKLDNSFLVSQKCTLVPIPLHKKRENWRGFNQAIEIGKFTARHMDWVFVPNLLTRYKNTKPQVGLKKAERKLNVKKVFCVNSEFYNQVNKKLPIVLFDDVLTTGATMKEAGKVLKKEGFERVWSVSIAG